MPKPNIFSEISKELEVVKANLGPDSDDPANSYARWLAEIISLVSETATDLAGDVEGCFRGDVIRLAATAIAAIEWFDEEGTA